MQNISMGTLETQARATRAALLAAIDGAPEAVLRAPGVVGDASIADWLGYLGVWNDTVNKGLREIQRDKKPGELLHAADKHDAFRREAIAEIRDEPLETTLNRLEDALYHWELRIKDLSVDHLNQPKQYRWLGNRPLWPLLAAWGYELEAQAIPTIAAYVQRAQQTPAPLA